MVLAVLNNKGGVGKTTASVNLAAALASPNRHVLLVDLDSQASASRWCGVSRQQLLPSSADCLLHNYPVTKAIRKSRTPNLDVITGSNELANADLTLCDIVGRELALKQAMQSIKTRYDLVILDCPPSLSLVGVNALVAADALIVPVTPQFLALEGLVSLLAAVEQVRTRLGSRVRLLGILLTMVAAGRGASDVNRSLRAQHRDRVFRTEIRISRALEEAPGRGETIFQYGPRSSAAGAFRQLATEVLDRLRDMSKVSFRDGTIRHDRRDS